MALFLALFLKLMGGKLNIFQNSGKFFGKLKENILKLNIIHNVEWTAALTSQSFYICECNTQQKLISLKKNSRNFRPKRNNFSKTLFFGNSIPVRWRQNGQKRAWLVNTTCSTSTLRKLTLHIYVQKRHITILVTYLQKFYVESSICHCGGGRSWPESPDKFCSNTSRQLGRPGLGPGIYIVSLLKYWCFRSNLRTFKRKKKKLKRNW